MISIYLPVGILVHLRTQEVKKITNTGFFFNTIYKPRRSNSYQPIYYTWYC